MFSKLNFFAKKQKKEQPKPQTKKAVKKQYAPNTKIEYRPNLVKQLTNEHQQLLSIFQAIIRAVEKDNQTEAKLLLDRFKAKFTGHIIKENVNFYVYVQHSVNDPLTLELIKDMRIEMDDIARAVRNFINEYTPKHVVLDAEFVEGFKEIGSALINRITQEEEHLYPTYQPTMS